MKSSIKLLVLVGAICLVNSSVLNTNLILEEENEGEDTTPNSYSAVNK